MNKIEFTILMDKYLCLLKDNQSNDTQIEAKCINVLNQVVEHEYGESGLEWIGWWLYELPLLRGHHTSIQVELKKPDIKININNIDGLYELLEFLKHAKA
jgi:hypothetical protein